MKLQVIQDGKGKPTGVYIPIHEWRRLKRRYKDLGDLERSESKEQILTEIKQAIYELKLIEKGKLKTRSAKALLDEL